MTRGIFLIVVVISLTFTLVGHFLIRFYYCSECNLHFNSQEFNNIATPLISLLGFVGLVVTILISLEPIKFGKSEILFNNYRKLIEDIRNNEEINFKVDELVHFYAYLDEKYDSLKTSREYLSDLQKYLHKMEGVESKGKSYDSLLGNIRLFNTEAIIVFKKIQNLIKEIDKNKQLVNTHRDLLMEALIGGIVSDYLVSFEIVEIEMKEVDDNLFLAFTSKYQTSDLKFFNSGFCELRNFMQTQKHLQKYIQR